MQVIKFVFRIALVLYGYVFTAEIAVAQEVSALHPGEKITGVASAAELGSSPLTVKLPNEGKAVLIDFWGVHCTGCITEMPSLLALQNKFNDQLQVLLVTSDSRQAVDSLWKKMDKSAHKGAKYSKVVGQLSSVYGDTLFSALFPHDRPAHIWIDKYGRFRYMAPTSMATEENISRFLKGDELPIRNLPIHYIDLEIEDPLSWINMDSTHANMASYSFWMRRWTKGLTTWGDKVFMNSAKTKPLGFACINKSAVDLLKLAYLGYPSYEAFPGSRICVEGKDRNTFFQPKEDSRFYEWADSSQFCYAIKIPDQGSDQLYTRMQNDIRGFLHLEASIEKRDVSCFVLRQVTESFKAVTTGGRPVDTVIEYGSRAEEVMHNQPFYRLNSYLQTALESIDPLVPFERELDYPGKIDVTLPSPGYDNVKISLEEINSSLEKIGLRVIKEKRNIEMLVIKESK